MVEVDYAVITLAALRDDTREVEVTVRITHGAGVEGIAPREITFRTSAWKAKDIRLGGPYHLSFGPVVPDAK